MVAWSKHVDHRHSERLLAPWDKSILWMENDKTIRWKSLIKSSLKHMRHPPAEQGNDCRHRARCVLCQWQILTGAMFDQNTYIKMSCRRLRRQPPRIKRSSHSKWLKALSRRDADPARNHDRIVPRIDQKTLTKLSLRCVRRYPPAAQTWMPARISMNYAAVSDYWHHQRCVLCECQIPTFPMFDRQMYLALNHASKIMNHTHK